MGPTREVVLNGSSLTSYSYEQDNWRYSLSFHGDKVIGGLYDLDSFDGNFYSNDIVTFKQNNKIASFVSGGNGTFTVEFALESRAQVDLSKSVINMTIGGEYANSHMFVELEDDDYTWYEFSYSFNSHFGKSVTIDSLKIVFACPL